MCSTHDSLVLYDVVGVVALEEEGAAVAPGSHRPEAQPHRKPDTGVPGAALYGSNGCSPCRPSPWSDSLLESCSKEPLKKFTSRGWRLVVVEAVHSEVYQYPLLTMGLPYARD